MKMTYDSINPINFLKISNALNIWHCEKYFTYVIVFGPYNIIACSYYCSHCKY